MPGAYCGEAVTIIDGKFYYIGSQIVEYDPRSDNWAILTTVPTWRYMLGAISTINNKIYVMGGADPIDQCGGWNEEYDPLANKWRTLTGMPHGRCLLAIATDKDGYIYAIGGYNDGGGDQTGNGKLNEKYTPEIWVGEDEITDNPQWIDSTHYQVSYELTALNPRGHYPLTVSDVNGGDGILIVPDTRNSFEVDYAGSISDVTIPEKPAVIAWGDGSLSNLYARWSANDSESEINLYRYAIGTFPGGSDVVNWTNTTITTLTKNGLNLSPDQAYYISVKARNVSGLWSQAGWSAGIVNGASYNFIFIPLLLK
jgi:hypothetical protein